MNGRRLPQRLRILSEMFPTNGSPNASQMRSTTRTALSDNGLIPNPMLKNGIQNAEIVKSTAKNGVLAPTAKASFWLKGMRSASGIATGRGGLVEALRGRVPTFFARSAAVRRDFTKQTNQSKKYASNKVLRKINDISNLPGIEKSRMLFAAVYARTGPVDSRTTRRVGRISCGGLHFPGLSIASLMAFEAW